VGRAGWREKLLPLKTLLLAEKKPSTREKKVQQNKREEE